MNGVQAVQAALQSTQGLATWFVSDLSDDDILVRPVPGANHIAWQLGNIIGGDIFLVNAELPDVKYPEIPAGFVELHGSQGTGKDGKEAGFLSKAEYVALLEQIRAVTVAAAGKLTDADLDKPCSPQMATFAKTIGDLFIGVANHTMMHAGQFSVVRRKLGKPVLL